MSARALVLDFDGTATLLDLGDALCDRFAAPRWREVEARYLRGELSLPEAQRQAWALFHATREEACAYARAVGALRPGLDALLEDARVKGYALHLASGGFDFYIEAVLGPERLARFAGVHCNSARFIGDRMEPVFADAVLGCPRCAVCKARVCERVGAAFLVGDGCSDACALGRVERVFAVDGAHLHRLARERGLAVTPFFDLAEVGQAL